MAQENESEAWLATGGKPSLTETIHASQAAGSPDAVARSIQVPRAVGAEPTTDDGLLKEMERVNAAARATQTLKPAPTATKWFEEPQNAAVAHDDAGPISRLEEVMRGLSAVTGSAARKTDAGLRLFAADRADFWLKSGLPLFPWDRRKLEKEAGGKRLAEAEAWDGDLMGKDDQPDLSDNAIGRWIYGGAASGIQAAPALAATIATKNPVVGLAIMGAQAAAPEYADVKLRGGTPGEAMLAAGGVGGVEVGTELLPLGFLVNKFGKAGAKQFIAGLLLREMPSEQVATLAQDFIDTAIANPDTTWAEFRASRLDAAAGTAVGTLMQSLFLGGAHYGVSRLTGQHKAMTDLGEAAQASKLRTRDPERFADLMGKLAEDSGLDTVYVDAAQFSTLFQSQGKSPADAARELGIDPVALTEAAQSGAPLAVPMKTWATKIAGTPVDDALKDHIKLDPDGMTFAEAEEFEKNRPELEAAAKEAQDAKDTESAAATTMRDSVINQLVEQGGYTRDQAAPMAALLVSGYQTMAKRTGKSMEDFLTAIPAPSIFGPVERSARPQPSQARVAPHITAAAEAAGVDPGYMTALANRESGFNPAAAASSSSATGLYQFVDKTWVNTIKAHGTEEEKAVAATITFANGKAVITDEAQRALMAGRVNPAKSSAMAAAFTKDNAKALEATLGRAPTSPELYAAHFLGNAGAAKLLKAGEGEDAAALMPTAARANPTIFYTGRGDARRGRTVAEVKANLARGFTGDIAVAPAAADVAEDDEATAGLTPEGRELAQFAGVNARTHDAFNLALAQDYEAQGRSTEETRRRTGWFRGDESKWRFEIDDSQSRVREDVATTIAQSPSGTIRLQDVMKHDDLFAAYPQLADVQVQVIDTEAEYGRKFGASVAHPDGDDSLGATVILIDKDTLDSPELLSVLNHEAAHLIQNQEDFARGATSSTTGLIRGGYGDALNRVRDAVDEARPYDSRIEQRRLSERLTYRASAGEIEARNVQKRLAFSPGARLTLSPEQTRDIPAANAIVVVGGNEIPVYRPVEGARSYAQSAAIGNAKVAAERIWRDPEFLAAKSDGLVADVGYDGDAVQIYNLDVEPGLRSRGIASRGLRRITEIADEVGVAVELEVGNEENAFDLVAWYGRHGFEMADGFMRREARPPQPARPMGGDRRTDTAAFKRWFGDSKVVDERGDPLVVYHGTNQPVEAFSAQRLGQNTRNAGALEGFFFTSSAQTASDYAEYAGKTQIAGAVEHEANVERLRTTAQRLEREAARTGNWDAYERAMEEWETAEAEAIQSDDITGQNVIPAYLKIENPKVRDFGGGGLPLDFPEWLAQAKADGHDGAILKNLSDPPPTASDHYVVFKPTQIKSVFNTGEFSPKDGRILYQSEPVGPYYSGLAKALEAVQTTRASPEQWAATIKGLPGVKAEELKWTGILDWLAGEDGPITRAQVQAYIANHGVKVEEVVLGGEADPNRYDTEEFYDIERELTDAAFSGWLNYNEPSINEVEPDEDDEDGQVRYEFDGEAYDTEQEAEDARSEWRQSAQEDFYSDDANMEARRAYDDAHPSEAKWGDYKLPGADESYRELLLTLPNIKGPATHFDQPNVMAHVRFTERTDAEGKRVLFIEEVQSDWHQKGREQGYASEFTPEEIAARRATLVEATAVTDAASLDLQQAALPHLDKLIETAPNLSVQTGWAAIRKQAERGHATLGSVLGVFTATDTKSDPAYQAWQAANLRLQEADQAYRNTSRGIPDAPFKSSWPTLAMKRMIRYAVDHGYEQIAWTTAEQIGPIVGQEPDKLSWFYSRNLVNDTNAIIKKYGAKVGEVAIPELSRANTWASGAEAGRALGMAEDRIGEWWQGLDQGQRDAVLDDYRKSMAVPTQPGFTITPEMAAAAKGGFALFQRQALNSERLKIERQNPPAGGVVDGLKVRETISNLGSIDASINEPIELGVREVPFPAEVDTTAGFSPRVRALAAEIEASGEIEPLIYVYSPEHPQGYVLEGAHRIDALMLLGKRSFPALVVLDNDSGFYDDELSQRRSEGERRRGSIILPNEGLGGGRQAAINLFAARDLSTFLHESGHLFLEMLLAAGRAPDASDQIKADLARLRAWWNIPPDGEVGVREHEMFAEGFEQYLYEGRAPSPGLAGAFESFRAWLSFIYRAVRGVRLDITDDVRGVMDRIIATDDAIAAMRSGQGMAPLFDNPAETLGSEMAGVYEDLTRRATAQAQAEADARVLGAVRAQAKLAYQLERQAVRTEVERDVIDRPVYRAFEWLAHGAWLQGAPPDELFPMKLDRQAVIDGYGEKALKALPKGFQVITAREGGVPPDVVADAFGFASGGDLIEALSGMEKRAAVIERETEEAMQKRHPDPMDNLPEVAADAAHNYSQQRVLEIELQHLGGNRATYAGMREAAKREAARRTVGELRSPDRHLNAERKAANAAQKAFRAGDLEEAARQKFKQLAAFHAWRASRDAADEIAKGERLFEKVTTGKDDAVAKRRDMDFVKAARAILSAYDVGKSGENPLAYLNLIRQNDPDLAASLEGQVEAASANAKPIAALTLDEYKGLRDTIASLWHMARRTRVMQAEGRAIDLEMAGGEVAMQIASRLGELPTGPSEALTDGQIVLRGLAGARFALRRVESWARLMDGGQIGPITRYVWRPISMAADMHRTMSGQWRAAYVALLREIEPTLTWVRIDARELNYTFAHKAELLHALLHTGNQSNKRKLLLGGQASGPWAAIHPDTEQVDERGWNGFVARMVQEGVLTQADFDFLQSTWDLLETTKPAAQRAHRAIFGRYFDEVTADSFVDPFGITRRGGYVPAKINTHLVQDADLRAEAERINSGGGFMFPQPTRGFTKSREENYAAPLALDLRLLAQHIDQVSMFANLAAPVRDVLRLMNRAEVKAAMAAVNPVAMKDMILPWLGRAARQATDVPLSGEGGRLFDRVLRGLNSRTGAQTMFLNFVNALQQVTGLTIAAVRVRPVHLAVSMSQFISAPGEIGDAVAEASPFMRDRLGGQSMEATRELSAILHKGNALTQVKQFTDRHTYFLQHAAQNFVDVVVWRGAYNQALEEGVEDAEAVNLADAAVRQTQGSMNAEDIARFESGNSIAKLFTKYASYFNMQANLIGTEMQLAGSERDVGRMVWVYVAAFAVPSILADLITKLLRGQLPDEDEDNGWIGWWLDVLMGSQVRGATAMLPVIGPGINATIARLNNKPFDDKLSLMPAASAADAAISAPVDIYKATTGGDKSRAVKDVFTLLGLVTGLPLGGLGRPAGYLTDVAEGDVEPTSGLDAVRGVVTGSPSDASRQ